MPFLQSINISYQLFCSDLHSDSQLPCCIWGNLAEKLHSAINQEDGTVTMLLRFAKVGRFRGIKSILESLSETKIDDIIYIHLNLFLCTL